MPRILIVESVHHQEIAKIMRDLVVSLLQECNTNYEIISVPGALELASAVNLATLDSSTYDGAIVLGCILKGETLHYDIVANQTIQSLQQIAIKKAIPLGTGVIMANNIEQAIARTKKYARGAFDACHALIELKNRYTR